MSEKVEVRFKPLLAAFLLVAGLFILGSTLLVGFSVNTVTGAILLLVGLAFLRVPMFVVTPAAIEQKNLIGVTVRTHLLENAQVSLTDAGIFVDDKKVVSSAFLSIDRPAVERLLGGRVGDRHATQDALNPSTSAPD